MPFFDDPFFRQFFGGPWGGQRRVPQERREQALGSGVSSSEDGYLLTNNHVVDGSDDIKVALPDEKTVLEAKVIGTDPHTDIAVIKVEGKKLPAIAITDSDNVEVGDLVLAIGNPFGVGQTVTSGIVSGKGRAGMAPGGIGWPSAIIVAPVGAPLLSPTRCRCARCGRAHACGRARTLVARIAEARRA
jgi:serine protease Do